MTISAQTNAEAHDISVAIRARRRAAGELGADRMAMAATDGAGERHYSLALTEGDKVRLFDRLNATFPATATRGNIGRNGSVLEVAALDERGLSLRNLAGREGFVSWDSLRDDKSCVRLAYGEALTTHTAQGSTVTVHIHAMPSGSRMVTAFGAYTSGSRHREQSFIVTSDGAERAEIAGRRPLGDRRDITARDVLENVIRNVSRQEEKESAISMVERAANLRRGMIHTVQATLQTMEARITTKQNPSPLPERLQEQHIARTLAERLPALTERLRRHGDRILEVGRRATDLADRFTEVIRRRHPAHRRQQDYWASVAKAAPHAPERRKARIQSRRPQR